MRIVLATKVMILSLLLAVATGATAVAQGSESDDTSGSHHSSSQLAENSTDDTTVETESTDDSTNTTTHVHSSSSTDRLAEHQTKLSAVKLKVCENRHKAISNIMGRIADRGQKQLDLFSTIATRTETFYTNKGKTLSNYDALVAAVNAKKAAAQTTVDSTKADSTGFTCDSADPQGSISQFKTDLKSEIQALKDYKTAVKNLIVGVKSVQSTTSTDNSTEAN
jgi:hypothetical protein